MLRFSNDVILAEKGEELENRFSRTDTFLREIFVLKTRNVRRA